MCIRDSRDGTAIERDAHPGGDRHRCTTYSGHTTLLNKRLLLKTNAPQQLAISIPPRPGSPDVAEDLATDTALAGLPVAHEALAGRQYGNAQAAKDAR